MSSFEQEQLHERLKDKEKRKDDKWHIKGLKSQAKEIRFNITKREQYLKVQAKVNRYDEYRKTKQLTADDFDNLGTSYTDYLTSNTTTHVLIVFAHIFNFLRKYGKEYTYRFSYKTIADDLNAYGCDIAEATVRYEVRRLREIGLIMAIPKDKVAKHLKGVNQHCYRILEINYTKLKELTTYHLRSIKGKELTEIEMKIATLPFVICKYDLDDKEAYMVFAYEVHKKLNKDSNNKNKYIKYKPQSLQTKTEQAINLLKNDNKGFKKKVKVKSKTKS